MRGVRSIRKFTHPLVTAKRNLGNCAVHVELHGRGFRKALESGDENIIDRQAWALYGWAKQAVSAGNLVLNGGKPVRQVWYELGCEEA